MAIWLNEPATWTKTEGDLSLTTAPGSDFWRKTHYGFVRDNGHFFGGEVVGDFAAEVEVAGEYRTLYDQAGLMVRVDEGAWMKCGIEFVEGRQHASVVVTRDFSDWSMCPLDDLPPSVRFRVVRRGDTLEVSWARPGSPWTAMRIAHLPMRETVLIGPMAASPEDRGFAVAFTGFHVEQPG